MTETVRSLLDSEIPIWFAASTIAFAGGITGHRLIAKYKKAGGNEEQVRFESGLSTAAIILGIAGYTITGIKAVNLERIRKNQRPIDANAD